MVPDPRPLLAITIGDPAGIGPEVVLKALRHPKVYARPRPLVIGDRPALERAASWIDATTIVFDVVSDVDAGRYDADVVTMLDLQNAPPDGYAIGKVSSEAGRAAVEYVFRACDLALETKVDAVVMAPLNKAAMHATGFTLAGHTVPAKIPGPGSQTDPTNRCSASKYPSTSGAVLSRIGLIRSAWRTTSSASTQSTQSPVVRSKAN